MTLIINNKYRTFLQQKKCGSVGDTPAYVVSLTVTTPYPQLQNLILTALLISKARETQHCLYQNVIRLSEILTADLIAFNILKEYQKINCNDEFPLTKKSITEK